jgi:hypothetical protein
VHTETVAGATLLAAPGLPTTIFNRVIGLGTFEPTTEAAIDATVARYRTLGVRQFWISVSPAAAPAQLGPWLSERGFQPPPRRSWVQMRWGDAAAPVIDTTFAVRVVQADEATALGQVIAAAFEMPPPMTTWLAALVGRAGWQGFAAFDGNAMAGGAFVFSRPPLGWLGMGAIARSHRGRNGQLALMAARIAHAQAQGCVSIHTETGEPVGDEPNPSLANMVRCGFECVCSRANLAFTAPA